MSHSAAQQHSTFTVQILYKLYSVQLNCTYSNYTQAAATCSAAQQHTNCPDDVFWSAVHPAVWYCESHIKKSDPSEKFRWLWTHCHNFTALRNPPKCLSGDCNGSWKFNLTVRIRWRNSGKWRDQTWRVRLAFQLTLTAPVWFNTPAANAFLWFKTLPDRREIFAAVATTTISPKFRVDCGKEIRVVNHTSASVLW